MKSYKNTRLENALDDLFKNSDLDYKIIDETIFIKPMETMLNFTVKVTKSKQNSLFKEK